MTTDKSSVRIIIYNDCGTEKFLNVFFPVVLRASKFYVLKLIESVILWVYYTSLLASVCLGILWRSTAGVGLNFDPIEFRPVGS